MFFDERIEDETGVNNDYVRCSNIAIGLPITIETGYRILATISLLQAISFVSLS